MEKKVLNRKEIDDKYKKLVEGKTYTQQQRGFELENLIYSILQNEGLEPRSGYKPEGEQIDGSFFWQGQTFLLEAKWVKDPLPASSIYAFKGKLDGKFHTTSGVYISVNGYSEELEDALKFGKSLNIILFDKGDIPLLFNGKVSFTEMLKFKLRQAGDTGSLQVSYKLTEDAKNISKLEPTIIQDFIQPSSSEEKPKQVVDDLLVFVEGKSDIFLINNLIEPIKKDYSLSYRIESLTGAYNLRQLPSLLNLYGVHSRTKAVIVILDNDQSKKEMSYVIQNIEKQLQNSSIYIRPIFLYISEELKSKLKEKLSIEELRNEPLFDRLESFIVQVAEDYYDPENDIPIEVLKSRLENLEWNYDEGKIELIDDETGMPYYIDCLENLIRYLEDEIGRALNGEMPIDWLKEHDFDHETEVREYLIDNYSEQIDKLGWNSNDL